MITVLKSAARRCPGFLNRSSAYGLRSHSKMNTPSQIQIYPPDIPNIPFYNSRPLEFGIPDKIPAPRGTIQTPTNFLKACGRDLHEKFTVESWEELFNADSAIMKKKGLPPKERKYLLRCLYRFRLGEDPKTFKVAAKPEKKKIRGYGPKVQNGRAVKQPLTHRERQVKKMANRI